MRNDESIIRDVAGVYSEGLEYEETSSAIMNEIKRFDKEKSTSDQLQLHTDIRREFLKLSIMTKNARQEIYIIKRFQIYYTFTRSRSDILRALNIRW